MAGRKQAEDLTEGALAEVTGSEVQGQQLDENVIGWGELEKLAESLGFNLVPEEKLNFEEATSLPVRKKGGKREIQNLRFDVKFKDSELRRGTFNSK